MDNERDAHYRALVRIQEVAARRRAKRMRLWKNDDESTCIGSSGPLRSNGTTNLRAELDKVLLSSPNPLVEISSESILSDVIKFDSLQ